MLRARVAAGSVALALLVVSACEKDKGESLSPDDSGGPEVIVEDPGAEPQVPDPVVPDGDTPDPDPQEAESPTTTSVDPGGTTVVATKVPCSEDADCVKDSCCHASSCVATANAPSCADTMCTMDCRAGTMDCYGGCLCQDGFCAAEIWDGPPG